MGNMHLVTGHAGTAHITAEDICDQNISIVGMEDYIVDDGGFSYTNNSHVFYISPGRLFMCGRFVRMTSQVTLTAHAIGVSRYRKDFIAARYTRDSNGIENVDLVIIEGDDSTRPDAEDPEITQDDLRDTGTVLYEMPMYRIEFGGGTITVTPIAARKKPIGQRSEEIKTIRSGTATIQYSDEHARSCNVAFSGFSSPPVVLVQQVFNRNNILVSSITANGFVATCPAFLDGSGAEGSREFTWVAIGE